MRHFFLFCLFVLLLSTSYSQKEGYNWYSNSDADTNLTAITFNSPDLKPISLKIDTAHEFNYNSVVTMSDNNGNLIFYSTFRAIYNRKNQIMEGGDSILNNVNSVISVKKPGNNSIYYIISTPFDKPQYLYSTIDMSYNNGLGKVIEQNKILITAKTNAGSWDLASVRHRNGMDLWILVTDDVQDIKSILLTENGFDTNGVTSNYVDKHEWINLSYVSYTFGFAGAFNNNTSFLKANQQGNKLVKIIQYDTTKYKGKFFNIDGLIVLNFPFDLLVADFDNSTGKMQNYKIIDDIGDTMVNINRALFKYYRAIGYYNTSYVHPFTYSSTGSFEYSPDGQKIYFGDGFICEADISNLDTNSIKKSIKSIDTTNQIRSYSFNGESGAITEGRYYQMGPDQKIHCRNAQGGINFIVGGSSFSQIEILNTTINFENGFNSIYNSKFKNINENLILDTTSLLTFFYGGFFSYPRFTNDVMLPPKQIACINNDANLLPPGTPSLLDSSYSWTGPYGFTSNLKHPLLKNFNSNDTGFYLVNVTDKNGKSYQSVLEVKGTISSISDMKILADSLYMKVGDTLILSADRDYDFYFWSDGKITKADTIYSPGNYSLSVLDTNSNCITTKNVLIQNDLYSVYFPNLNIIPGMTDLKIPLKITTNYHLTTPVDLFWTAKVSFDATVFIPNNSNYQIKGNRGFMDLNGICHLIGDSSTLTIIDGKSFLGDSLNSILDIIKFDFLDSSIYAKKINGSLNYNICGSNIRLIGFRTLTDLIVSSDIIEQNNEPIKFNMITQEEGNFNVSLYNSIGNKISELTYNKENQEVENKQFSFDFNNLSTDVYFIVLTSPNEVISKKLTIVK